MTDTLLTPDLAVMPHVLHYPPDVISSSGVEAVEFAAACGITLDDWQAWTVTNALSERRSGRADDPIEYAAFECGIITPRQNGKNFVLECIQLASLYLFGDMTLVHSAHKFDTSVEHFNRLRWLFENTPELSSLLLSQDRSFVTSNGKEHIRLNTGQRILFKARYRGSSRGFVGDKVFMDEAFDIDPAAMGATIPTLSTRRGAQVYYTSSAPHTSSQVLHAVRRRALKADPTDRLFYAEWGNDVEALDLRPEEPEFMEAIRRANPAVAAGRITEAYIVQEIHTFSGDPDLVEEHRRERLGVPSMPTGTDGGPIPLEVWEALKDVDSSSADVRLAFDVSPDRSMACFGLAGRRSDGLGHVAVRQRMPGTDWVVGRAVELAAGHGCPIRIAVGSPGASFVEEMILAGVPVELVKPADYAAACGRFLDGCLGDHPTLRHLGDPLLARTLGIAVTKPTQDGAWTWSRRGSSGDITALTTITLAWAAIDTPLAPPDWDGDLVDLGDYLDDDED
ncbi:MAG TPA: hypothetical protein VMY16_11420 [Ilumatobacteraceae bacterium]|nr:hypothetical protein [Ilumatobacteraceae bacterium]